MLVVGQIIRMLNGKIYRVESVSSSRAYCIPIHQGKIRTAEVSADTTDPGDVPGAINISPNSYVEVIEADNLEEALSGSKPQPAQAAKANPSALNRQGRDAMGSVSSIPVASSRSTVDKNKDRRQSLARKRADKHAGLPGTGATRKLAGAAARAVANKKPKPAKTVRACACGCGTETMSYFAPGHDARMHGLIKKLADGRMQPKDYQYPSVIKKLDLVETKTGFKAKNPHFWEE